MADEAYKVMYRPNNHDFSRAFVGTVLVLVFIVVYFFVAQERQVWARQRWTYRSANPIIGPSTLVAQGPIKSASLVSLFTFLFDYLFV